MYALLFISTGTSWLDSIIIGVIILFITSRPQLSFHVLVSSLFIYFFYQVVLFSISKHVEPEEELKNNIASIEQSIKQQSGKILMQLEAIPEKLKQDQIKELKSLSDNLVNIYHSRDSLAFYRDSLANLKNENEKSRAIMAQKNIQFDIFNGIDVDPVGETTLSDFLKEIKIDNDTSLFYAIFQIQSNLPNLEKQLMPEDPQKSGNKNIFISALSEIVLFPINFIPIEDTFINSLIVVFICIFSFACSIGLYFKERTFMPNKDEIERFKGANIFKKYGNLIFSEAIPIGIEEGATRSSEDIKRNMMDYLLQNINTNFSSIRGYSQSLITAQDLDEKTDSRIFIKTRFMTVRNSSLFYFIYIDTIGNQIIIYHTAYVQGTHKWYHALSFFATAPVSIWFWLYKYIKGTYNILGKLNTRISPSSYEAIDLKSYFQSISFNVIMSIKQFAKKNKLLTEDLSNIINNSISNTQNVNITKSKGVKLRNISLKSQ